MFFPCFWYGRYMCCDKEKTKPKDLYYNDYDSIAGFISYFYQIDLVRKLGVNKVLEVGVGNKTVSNYLRHNGFDITTYDCNESLEPDVVGDIKELPFEDSSYEVIMACEVLEHLPWNDMPKTIDELFRVTSKYVIISIPFTSLYFEAAIKFPMYNKILKKYCLDLFIRLPFAIFAGCSKHHQWEIGLKGYSLRKVRKEIKRKFRILKEVRPILQPKHYFFVLQKVQ